MTDQVKDINDPDLVTLHNFYKNNLKKMFDICNEHLNKEGNHEYKRLFKNINSKKLNELSSQMNWRLEEGCGICYYYIGINDNGTIYSKLNQDEINYSLKIIKTICKNAL